MDLAPIATIAGPIVVGLVQAIRSRYGITPARRQALRDIELYNKLPDAATSRALLLSHIDESIKRLLQDEATKRRDRFGIGVAIGLLVAASPFVYYGVTANSWGWTWWIGAAALGIFGLGGLGISVPLAVRDEKGHQLNRASAKRKAGRPTRPGRG